MLLTPGYLESLEEILLLCHKESWGSGFHHLAAAWVNLPVALETLQSAWGLCGNGTVKEMLGKGNERQWCCALEHSCAWRLFACCVPLWGKKKGKLLVEYRAATLGTLFASAEGCKERR